MTTKRKRNALSAVFVQSVQETGTYADGGGLNLRVEDSGAKFWFQRVTIDGKRRNLGLGGYPTVSLAKARKAALVNSRMIREGRDPLAEKREAITARQRPPTPTFAEASEIVIDMRRPTWTNAKHASQWASTLTTYAFPKIGPKPVTDITSADVLSVLTPIWTAKPETASRVRQRMETVLDWAVAQGYRTDNPGTRSIAKVLPKTPRTKQHFAALRYRDVPAALEQVNGSSADSITKLAFEFLVLTAARSGEVRLATWNEFDWRGRRWTVPAERMKARREHQVPLSDRSIERDARLTEALVLCFHRMLTHSVPYRQSIRGRYRPRRGRRLLPAQRPTATKCGAWWPSSRAGSTRGRPPPATPSSRPSSPTITPAAVVWGVHSCPDDTLKHASHATENVEIGPPRIRRPRAVIFHSSNRTFAGPRTYTQRSDTWTKP